MPVKLILIRHGESNWNVRKIYCGLRNAHLTAEGKRQAGCLARRLKKEKIDQVYSSDRIRARQTAGIIFAGRHIEIDPELREINFGVLEGLNYKQAISKYPKIYKKWLKEPFSITLPKAESLPDFRKRVVGAIGRIARINPKETVAIVAHGGVISIFITYILHSRDFWGHIPLAGSITKVVLKGKKFKIERFNDTRHL